jgi:hypothetical protein
MYKATASFHYQPSLDAEILQAYLNKNRKRRDAGTRKIKRSLRKLRGLGH